jgi:hypothetical protein
MPSTAAINKQLAIGCYKRASDKAFSRANIKGGFSYTGIVPFNPEKVYRRLRMVNNVEEDIQAEERPSTPQIPKIPIGLSIKTPQKATDLFAITNRVVNSINQVQKKVQTLVVKTGKKLDSTLEEVTLLKDENKRLNTKNVDTNAE